MRVPRHRVHRRLKVIDLEGGQQPIVGSDGRYRLVYDGEIYNFRELRVELEGKGRRFHTRSDTEVLPPAYERWGPGCVSRLSGILTYLPEQLMGENFGDRRKRGFTVPKHRWVQAQPAAALKEALLPAGIEAWFDPARLTSHVLESPRGTELAWPLLAFAHWFHHYLRSG